MISVEIMKTIDEREMKKAKKEKQTNVERSNYRHLLLSITSSLYNTPYNRFYNNYVINICPRQLL